MRNMKAQWWIGLLALVLGIAACTDQATDTGSNSAEITPTPAVTFVPNTSFSSSANASEVTTLETQTLALGQGTLSLNVTMPVGYKFNGAAPLTLTLSSMGDAVSFDESWSNYQQVEPTMPLAVPLTLREGNALLNMGLTIYWCEAVKQTLCFVERRQLQVPLSIEADSSNQTAHVDLALVPPDVNTP